MSDKALSKADKLRAMREATFTANHSSGAKGKPQMPAGSKTGDGLARNSSDGGVEGHAAGVVPVKPVHGIGSEHRVRKARSGSQASVESRPSETDPKPPVIGECPVCAERRRRKAKAQKNWRKKAKKK
jgi:hypothetical protein